jgi:hypothetical protein
MQTLEPLAPATTAGEIQMPLFFAVKILVESETVPFRLVIQGTTTRRFRPDTEEEGRDSRSDIIYPRAELPATRDDLESIAVAHACHLDAWKNRPLGQHPLEPWVLNESLDDP